VPDAPIAPAGGDACEGVGDEPAHRKASERFIAHASRLLASSLDYQETIQRVAQLAVPAFADWCLVDLLTDDGASFDRVGIAFHPSSDAATIASLKRRYPLRTNATEGVPRAIVDRQSRLRSDVTEEVLQEIACDDGHLHALRSLGMRSFVVAPLVARGRAIGALTLLACHKEFDERDLWLADQLATSAAVAIDNARLFEAERRSNERLRVLAAAGEALAQSLDLDETLQAVARLAIPTFADWCVIDLVEGCEIRRVATAHADDAKVLAAQDLARRRPARVGEGRGIGKVIADGMPRFHPRLEADIVCRAARDPEELAWMQATHSVSAIVVPMRSRDGCIGAISFATAESGRIYDEEDLRFAQELGRRAALAISTARLYRDAREAAQRAEDAARRAAEERRRAEEANLTKDEFLATVSHELRTPLNAITGWATLLAQKVSDPASVTKGIDVIRRNAQTQVRLVEDILDVSRIVTGKLRIDPRPVDLMTIVRDALEVVRPSSQAKQLTIEFDAPEDATCRLVADGPRLQQVVWNLLSNAIKFTNTAGRVIVRLEQDGTEVTVAVTDDGRGIDEDFLPHVFERFRQADSSTTRKVGGLGLGLAIVRHIIELHGGRVSVTSGGAGKGATFQFVIPVRAVVAPSADDERSRLRGEHESPETPDLTGFRVLVVDDEPDALELFETMLMHAGAVVATASSVREALAALDRFAPELVVSDIGMPGEDGYAFIQQLRQRPASKGGTVPAVAVTAYARAHDRIRALTSGYSSHVTKPVDPGELVAVIAGLRQVAQRESARPH
jgi:signal transduction histidine kinase/ActR/RegA family two-component response regulator